MKDKRNVYCEYNFWENFFNLENNEEIRKDRKLRHLWDDFYYFLENCILNFDIDKSKVDKNTVGGRAILEFYQVRGGANINFLSDKFPVIENISNKDNELLNSVFLQSKDTNVCNSLSENKGILVFNTDMVFSAKHVYENNGESLTRENGKNWDYMMEFKEKNPSISYCNSMVIADRYLFVDRWDKNGNLIPDDSIFDFNLKPIFNALLPNSLSGGICFNICIITENKCYNICDKIKRVESLVEDIRPNLSFSINVFNSRHLHDRSILTNNILLTSGAGFDVIGRYNTPLKFTTTMLTFPFLEQNKKDNEYYVEWINNVLKEKEKCKCYNGNYWGDIEIDHHLLDYYYEPPKIQRSTFTLADKCLQSLLACLE